MTQTPPKYDGKEVPLTPPLSTGPVEAPYDVQPKGGGKVTMQSAQCLQCAHFHISDNTCDAFPAGIPAPIITGEFDHTQPYPGDNGVRFEPLNVEAGPQAE